jgi:hypothetical protein
MLLLPDRETGEAWEPSKTQCSFVGALDKKVISLGIFTLFEVIQVK